MLPLSTEGGLTFQSILPKYKTVVATDCESAPCRLLEGNQAGMPMEDAFDDLHQQALLLAVAAAASDEGGQGWQEGWAGPAGGALSYQRWPASDRKSVV